MNLSNSSISLLHNCSTANSSEVVYYFQISRQLPCLHALVGEETPIDFAARFATLEEAHEARHSCVFGFETFLTNKVRRCQQIMNRNLTVKLPKVFFHKGVFHNRFFTEP